MMETYGLLNDIGNVVADRYSGSFFVVQTWMRGRKIVEELEIVLKDKQRRDELTRVECMIKFHCE